MLNFIQRKNNNQLTLDWFKLGGLPVVKEEISKVEFPDKDNPYWTLCMADGSIIYTDEAVSFKTAPKKTS